MASDGPAIVRLPAHAVLLGVVLVVVAAARVSCRTGRLGCGLGRLSGNNGSIHVAALDGASLKARCSAAGGLAGALSVKILNEYNSSIKEYNARGSLGYISDTSIRTSPIADKSSKKRMC